MIAHKEILSNMFKEGSCTVDYSFHQENAIREKEVFIKYTNAVNENKEW